MSNNKNLILTIAFVFGFLLFWDRVVVTRYAPSKTANRTSSTTIGPDSKLEALDVQNQLTGPETTTTLTAPGISVLIDSRGAGVRHWQIEEKDHWVELLSAAPKDSLLSLQTFPDLNFKLVSSDPSRATFAADSGQGFRIEKTYQLLAEPPFHSLTITFTNTSKAPLSIPSQVGWVGGLYKRKMGLEPNPKEESAVKAEMRAVAFADQVQSFRPGAIFGRTIDAISAGAHEWMGIDNNHFIAALISKNQSLKDLTVRASRSTMPQIAAPFLHTLQPKESVTDSFLMYVGPKKYTQLQKLGYHLDASVDFGVFGVIAKVLLRCLDYFHSLTGNYGWAIVILTVLVQLLVFPLTKKSLQHSVKMKELQPQLKGLQEQFKKDPKRLQIETLNLYRKNGMKLMGMEGCLPVLLQMPIFFALYATMRVAYELRGAPWIFWIHDLGARDPYYVLPILMGLGMFVQQKVTNVAVDPAQAKMMMFMPIMFTFMFLQFPAGLVLYWVVNSLTTLCIQRILTMHIHRSKNSPLPTT